MANHILDDKTPIELQMLLLGFLPPEDRMRARLINRSMHEAFHALPKEMKDADRAQFVDRATRHVDRMKSLFDQRRGKLAASIANARPELTLAVIDVLTGADSEKQTAIDELFRKVMRITGAPGSDAARIALIVANAGIGQVSEGAVASSSASRWCAVS